ncbi:MAG: LptE family protein [Salinivirgaceae bacterium]|nr:LptE family protein [Salinivirgaceae bacterium]
MKNYKIIAFILVIGFFSGCTIKYSFTGASIPQGAKSVSVANFPDFSPSGYPTLSNTLTESLKDKFISQTSLQLVQSQGDLQFEGSIIEYKVAPMSIQAGSDVAAQNRLTIGVSVKFINTIDPEANYETKFSQYSEYESIESLTVVQSTLVDEIVEKLVDDIFNKAVVNW